ncbi:MAG: threonylcarbamoyl-AMP synthase [Muribaculaceae bacterium]|nr:threonylcarbamoyl-AMP synthase [Bacteroides sp.]MDE6229320.1 threonylcarbamoyl-AMP synthase [Muribaculaceae bacterium]
MEILTLYSADMRAIEQAVDALRDGKLVIYPTDTHPALAADSLNPAAIAALCRLKGVNPDKHTLTLVCDSIATAAQYARIDNRAFQIVKRNSPGPFTFILPPATTLPKVYKGRKEVGVRIPDNDIARALAAELGHPLLSGSLGTSDPTELDHAVELMLVDGVKEYDVDVQSSTIVSLLDSANPEIVREGSLELQ